MRIAVVGLGKIGLPLAVQYATKGHDVVGVDVSPAVVKDVNAAREPFPGEEHLADLLGDVVPPGRLRATTDYADAIPGVDTIVVAVPLFVDDESRPDYAIMDSAAGSIGFHLTAGTLVSFETTLPVGTTRTRLAPLLENGSGLVAGRDFHVVFSPERVLTGRVFQDLRRYPKIVGGLEPEGARRAVEFYETVLDFDERPDLARPNGVWDLGTAEASELTKLAETTYRDVNIGLANQFAKFAEKSGIDIYEVIEASNSQPFSHIHQPGVAVGGHCIPVYPRLYLANDPDATIVRSAREANADMPKHAVNLLEAAYGDLAGARVVVLGAAYRGGVKETAFSGVFPLVSELESRGAVATVHDPLYSDEELNAMGLTAQPLGVQVDAVILHTDHGEYRELAASQVPGAKVFVDGRNSAAVVQVAPVQVTLGRPVPDALDGR
ncbi:nucleotide sugar dehydrogenase [Aeromicrobium wangtongii]|uniref:nucleotide sugar dehydrogenase n=1 Tax=Aeromicrobium wangtongii TaxID=2969247 RepID=UPI00201734A8|nr:nucleotide sugar dehydrogenase [Aeromicrobium wangtongii]MCL3817579.1 nucleotide sugar dehydrogenase [Aeromicrobium wangtongii]